MKQKSKIANTKKKKEKKLKIGYTHEMCTSTKIITFILVYYTFIKKILRLWFVNR